MDEFCDVKLEELFEDTKEGGVDVYTDGACSGNPGPGGWASVFVRGLKRTRLSGGNRQTTNNRMELTAAIESLKVIPTSAKATLYTDSSYLKNGATLWMMGWRTNGWKSSSGTVVKNQDLWNILAELLENRDIAWVLVKGHSNCTHNNLADSIAKSEIISMYIREGG
jgi:ribonuclease HI